LLFLVVGVNLSSSHNVITGDRSLGVEISFFRIGTDKCGNLDTLLWSKASLKVYAYASKDRILLFRHRESQVIKRFQNSIVPLLFYCAVYIPHQCTSQRRSVFDDVVSMCCIADTNAANTGYSIYREVPMSSLRAAALAMLLHFVGKLEPFN